MPASTSLALGVQIVAGMERDEQRSHRLVYISPGGGDFLSIGYAVFSITVLISPLVVGLISSRLVGEDACSEPYEMLCLTSVRNARLVWSYLSAALYRSRVLLAIVVGLMPLFLFFQFEANRIAFLSQTITTECLICRQVSGQLLLSKLLPGQLVLGWLLIFLA